MDTRLPYVKPRLTKLRTRWPHMGPEELPADVQGPSPPAEAPDRLLLRPARLLAGLAGLLLGVRDLPIHVGRSG
jgi:hypothetical protein